MKSYQHTNKYLTQKERFVILAVYLALFYLLYAWVNNTWIPSDGGKSLWFVSAIGFISFSLIEAPFFTKPNDTLASAIAGLLVLLSIDFPEGLQYSSELNVIRWIAVAGTILLFIATTIAIWTRDIDVSEKPKTKSFSKACYVISVYPGIPAFIFTPPALIGIFGFYQSNPAQLAVLSFAWIVLVVMRPLEFIWQIGKMLWERGETKEPVQKTGTIMRVDSPNLVRVVIDPSVSWDTDSVQVACLADSTQVYVLPLYSQIRDGDHVGTGLCVGAANPLVPDVMPGSVCTASSQSLKRHELIKQLSNHDGNVELIGFVVEGSKIASIEFELSTQMPLEEGHLVFCTQGGSTVYYQITDARTSEESFERNPRGTYVVTASQVGILTPDKGFVKYPWLPEMNAPVFHTSDPIQLAKDEPSTPGMKLGELPGSKVEVNANLDDLLGFHTAILGMTGMGKTELAFDIIRHALNEGFKVFCVDFTGDYSVRLVDCEPISLALEESEVSELDDLISKVEEGTYGAGEEKKKLREYVDDLRPTVVKRVQEFLADQKAGLGIFALPEIVNTAATLRVTELYLSAVFKWARNNRGAQRILLVLEEAHTIVPEFTMYDRDKANTGAFVGRMTQIALQGRKYGVGLLVISQRTALVSKTVLSQCNTCITFSLVDQTSLDYLANFYGKDHIRTIPRLSPRQALVFGKGILSERPIIMEIPFDPDKELKSKIIGVNVTPVYSVEPVVAQEEDDILFPVVAQEEDDIPF